MNDGKDAEFEEFWHNFTYSSGNFSVVWVAKQAWNKAIELTEKRLLELLPEKAKFVDLGFDSAQKIQADSWNRCLEEIRSRIEKGSGMK